MLFSKMLTMDIKKFPIPETPRIYKNSPLLTGMATAAGEAATGNGVEAAGGL